MVQSRDFESKHQRRKIETESHLSLVKKKMQEFESGLDSMIERAEKNDFSKEKAETEKMIQLFEFAVKSKIVSRKSLATIVEIHGCQQRNQQKCFAALNMYIQTVAATSKIFKSNKN